MNQDAAPVVDTDINTNPVVVELTDCTKVYRQGQVEVHALRGLSLRVRRGEFTAISGPSGSGKTTALNLIGGLDQPTAGQLTVGGLNLLDVRNEKGHDVGSEYFAIHEGQLCLHRPVMPSMLTKDIEVIRQDCLCYLMERYGDHLTA